MTTKTHRLILAGLGNVNRSFLGILQSQAALLRERYGLAFTIVGAADSGGAAIDPAGLDIAALLAAKRAGSSVATLPALAAPVSPRSTWRAAWMPTRCWKPRR